MIRFGPPGMEKLTNKLFPGKVMNENSIIAIPVTVLVVAYLELKMHKHADTQWTIVERAYWLVGEGVKDKVEAQVVREKGKGIIKKVLKVSHPYITGDGSATNLKQDDEKEEGEDSWMDESIEGW